MIQMIGKVIDDNISSIKNKKTGVDYVSRNLLVKDMVSGKVSSVRVPSDYKVKVDKDGLTTFCSDENFFFGSVAKYFDKSLSKYSYALIDYYISVRRSS